MRSGAIAKVSCPASAVAQVVRWGAGGRSVCNTLSTRHVSQVSSCRWRGRHPTRRSPGGVLYEGVLSESARDTRHG